MKNFLTFIWCCWLSCSFLQAQIVTVSEEISLRNEESYDLIGMLEGQFLLFQDRGTEFLVQAFNEQMKRSWDKEITLDEKRPEVLGIVSDEKGFDLLYHFRREGNTVVKMHRYDPAANLIDSVTIKDYGYKFYTPNFLVVRSEDRSKVLVFFDENQNEIDAVSFDLNTKKVLWEKHLQLQDFSFNQDFLQVLVDDKGDMHLIIEKDNFNRRNKEHHYAIYHHEGATDLLTRYEVSMRGRLTYDAFFDYDNLNEKLVAGGMYSNKNMARAEGYFYLSVSPDDPEQQLLKFQKFDDYLVYTFMEKNKTKGITEAVVQEVVLRRDGGILMIIEGLKEYERRVASTNRGIYDYSGSPFMIDYYYDDLLMISIHPNGRTHWETILHKKQYSQDDGAVYSSYFLFKTPTALRLLFNDEIKPENTVSEYVIQGNGGYDRNSVMSTENQRLRLRFRDGMQIAVNELIIPSERRNRLKLVKVTF